MLRLVYKFKSYIFSTNRCATQDIGNIPIERMCFRSIEHWWVKSFQLLQEDVQDAHFDTSNTWGAKS